MSLLRNYKRPKFKACPVCKADDALFLEHSATEWWDARRHLESDNCRVGCANCGVRGESALTRRAAILAWNWLAHQTKGPDA